MRTKILIIGWEPNLWEGMKTHELKVLSEKYDIVFSFNAIQALHEIAKAKFSEKNPVCGLVITRNRLVGQPEKSKLIADFAVNCSDVGCICINMITSDSDNDAKHHAVSQYFANQDDWGHVETVLNDNVKEIGSHFAFGEHWNELPEYVGYVPEQYESWQALKNQFDASEKFSHERPLAMNIQRDNTIVRVDLYGFKIPDSSEKETAGVALCKTVIKNEFIAIAW